MRISPKFPRRRVHMPMRRAEYIIYQLLRDTPLPGRALYEARVSPKTKEIDFAVWLEEVARYAVEVKGGRYKLDGDEWHLITAGSHYPKPSPVSQASEAAMSIPTIIQERLHRKVDIIPVLAMPDMEPDPIIADNAAQLGVEVLFGTENWLQRLVNLAERWRTIVPPCGEQIEEEIAVVMPNLEK